MKMKRLSRLFSTAQPNSFSPTLIGSTLVSCAIAWCLLAPVLEAQQRGLRIGPRDRIQLRVDELPDLNGEQEVAEDGTLNLPIIGKVEAVGLDEQTLAQRLREKLEAEGLRRATVSVTVTAYRSRPVSILGAVTQPGNHSVPGRITLLELLMDAGGLADDHGEVILIRRRAENGLSDQVQISVDALIRQGDPMVNIPIRAGDLINIPPARDIEIFFLGEVKTPGSLVFRGSKPVTLLTAIARAGGLTDIASKKIRIKRGTGQGRSQEIMVDYRQVLDGQIQDPRLENGDIIIVKESFF